MMKNYIFILLCFFLGNAKSQSCESVVYYDNMEAFTWFGNWWTPASTVGFFTNVSVSPPASAAIYGLGNGSSGREQDWYVLPNVTGLNPIATYKVTFRLGSYFISNPSAATRGVDSPDFVDVQLSTDGGFTYTSEMRISGFSNAYWDFNTLGVASKTANGINTLFRPASGGNRTTTGDGYSVIELIIPPGNTQIAVDILCRVNASGEEWWIDNIELIEILPDPVISISGITYLCLGDLISLTASGGDTYSWSDGIQNSIDFAPTVSSNYIVTVTNNGMINGDGLINTCSSTSSISVTVDNDCFLPIYLSSFSGENINTSNHLYWITEEEKNSSHFEIERSKNGVDYYYIGKVNANETNPYEFIDESPLTGDNYYRLKMVDETGLFSYSSVINIEVIKENTDFVFFPNPLNENLLTYKTNLSFSNNMIVRIYDINGRQVFNYIYENLNYANTLTLNLETLSSGSYLINVIRDDGLVHTQKILKI